MALDLAEIRKECVYRTKAPIGRILADLNELEALLTAERLQRKRLRWLAFLCFIVGAVTAFLHAFLAMVLFFAAVGVLAFLILRSGRLLDHSSRSEFLRELLAVLQQDSSSKVPYRIELWLKSRAQQVREQPWTRRKKGKERFSTDEWLSVEGRLLDGTEVSETVTDLIRKRTYSNANNKRKTKTRTRALIALKLGYSSEVFGNAQMAHRGLRNAIKVPSTTMVKRVQVTEKAVSLKAVVNTEKDLKQANLMLFLGAYRILNLSRQLAAKGRGQ